MSNVILFLKIALILIIIHIIGLNTHMLDFFKIEIYLELGYKLGICWVPNNLWFTEHLFHLVSTLLLHLIKNYEAVRFGFLVEHWHIIHWEIQKHSLLQLSPRCSTNFWLNGFQSSFIDIWSCHVFTTTGGWIQSVFAVSLKSSWRSFLIGFSRTRIK